MPSPFPGMDPYLENPNRWGGVHMGLTVAVMAALNQVLPDGYFAEIDLFVWAGDQPEERPEALIRKPDVFVPTLRRKRSEVPAAGLAASPPTVRTRMPGPFVRRNRRVRVLTADGREVVTVLEILSPSNKRAGEDRRTYLTERAECFASQANFIEIDLLRDGDRMPMGDPPPPAADYYVLVSPADRRSEAHVWAWPVPAPVPTFAVPLRPRTSAVPLDLHWCLDRVYDEGRYADKLDYTTPPVPPLGPEDAVWAADLLKKHARKRK